SKIPGRVSGGTRQPAEDFGVLADRLNEIAGSQGNDRLGASHAALLPRNGAWPAPVPYCITMPPE
ncbi:MAG: hypothetical protein O7C61_04085, partial [SAR324 cluster bacterium]|nr:hypothetical protein [SAR324 cluster bacterium]